mmetsp:Transcript_18558/g.60472  ORF Transcript_18558/g.60472 Transcript_18558/m.60472 type:complete len:406 (+) Transcript_18558:1116-2333(+)
MSALTPQQVRERRKTLEGEQVAPGIDPLSSLGSPAPVAMSLFADPGEGHGALLRQRASAAGAEVAAGGAAQVTPAVLHKLAAVGAWRPMVEAAQRALAVAPGEEAGSAQRVQLAAWHTLGLAKLRTYGVCVEAARSALAGASSAATAVSAGPGPAFAMQWIASEVADGVKGPSMGTVRGLTALAGRARSAGAEARRTGEAECATEWDEAFRLVVVSLVTTHVTAGNFQLALQWLDRLMVESPSNPWLYSTFGTVLLQVGYIRKAEEAFSRAKALCDEAEKAGSIDAEEVASLRARVARDSGLMYFARGEYKQALEVFDQVLAKAPWDWVAANNKALCMVYSRNLHGAISTLEAAIATDGTTAGLQEGMVTNLQSCYELLTAPVSAPAKRELASWLAVQTPDDWES